MRRGRTHHPVHFVFVQAGFCFRQTRNFLLKSQVRCLKCVIHGSVYVNPYLLSTINLASFNQRQLSHAWPISIH